MESSKKHFTSDSVSLKQKLLLFCQMWPEPQQELRQGSPCCDVCSVLPSLPWLGLKPEAELCPGQEVLLSRECLHLGTEPLPSQHLNLCLLRITRFHVAAHEAFAAVCTRGGVFPLEALQISVRLQVPSESWSCFTGVAKVIWWEGNALVICC